MPKLFRRLAAWAVNRRAGLVTSTFLTYLRGKTEDLLHRTADFLNQGSTAAPTYHLVDMCDSDARFVPWPGEVVFREKPSKLLGPDGKVPQW